MMDRAGATAILDALIRFALLAFVATLPFASFAIASDVSISFVAAVPFIAFKFVSVVLLRRHPSLEPTVLTLGVLVAYLGSREVATNGWALDREYFGTFALNYIMFVAIVDEFKRKPSLAIWSMLAFSVSVAGIAALTQLSLGAATSQSQRVTFHGLNENEMALSCLMAFTAISLRLHWEHDRAWRQLALYSMAIILIIALVGTGTRFALLALIGHLVLLSIYLMLVRERNMVRLVSAVSLLTLTVIATASSATMMHRLDPAMGAGRSDSDGVLELGGRLGLWRNAAEAFLQSPLFGLSYEGYQKYQLLKIGYESLPHNFAIEIAAIGGLVGLCLLIFLFLQLLSRIGDCVRAGEPNVVLAALPLIAAIAFLNVTSIKTVWFYLAVFLVGNLRSWTKVRRATDTGSVGAPVTSAGG